MYAGAVNRSLIVLYLSTWYCTNKLSRPGHERGHGQLRQFLSGTPWSCPKIGKRMVGDNCLGMPATGGEVFPEVKLAPSRAFSS